MMRNTVYYNDFDMICSESDVSTQQFHSLRCVCGEHDKRVVLSHSIADDGVIRIAPFLAAQDSRWYVIGIEAILTSADVSPGQNLTFELFDSRFVFIVPYVSRIQEQHTTVYGEVTWPVIEKHG